MRSLRDGCRFDPNPHRHYDGECPKAPLDDRPTAHELHDQELDRDDAYYGTNDRTWHDPEPQPETVALFDPID